MIIDTKQLVQLKDAGSVTGYRPESLFTYAALVENFPKAVMRVGNAGLYRKADLVKWAARRREKTKSRKARL